MNPTHCEMKFLNHEQFLKFVEKFGNEKKEIDFKYFGLKDEDLLEAQQDGGTKTFIDILNDTIRFVTKEPPYEFNFRFQHFGYDISFSCRSDNGEGIKGYIIKKLYYVTHLFYAEDEFEKLVDYKESGEYKWNQKVRSHTIQKAKPNVTMRNLDGRYGIISVVSAHHLSINELEMREMYNFSLNVKKDKGHKMGLTVTVPKITTTLPIPTEKVIAHYTDIRRAIKDGWAVDVYDAQILNDLEQK
ncbi:MAG: hypothetical protein K6E51_02820 [Treponema sp.]|nr:hypothetical protein [Treponema sp.]